MDPADRSGAGHCAHDEQVVWIDQAGRMGLVRLAATYI